MTHRPGRELSVRLGQTDGRHEGTEPHTTAVTLHCQLQQGDVVAVRSRLPEIRLRSPTFRSGENLLELIVEPVLLYLEGDLGRVSGRVEIVLAQHHQDIFVDNAPASIKMPRGVTGRSKISYPKQ